MMSKFFQATGSWYNCGYVIREEGEYIYVRHPLTGWEQQIWVQALPHLYRELTMPEVAELHLNWP